jgi:hypothetical protein
MESQLKFQFELWRLLLAVTLFAAALGLVKWGVWEIDAYGGGFVTSLLFIIAAVSVAAGVGSLFRRACEFAARAFFFLVEWFWWP